MARFSRSAFVLSVAAAAAGATARPARAQSAPAPALTTIRVGASADDQTSPILWAMRTGLFERNGIKLELTKMNSGAAVAAGVASGAIDVGKSSSLALVIGHAKGVPFTIIAPAGLWASKPEGGLLVRTDSPIRVAKDFAGKTVSAAAVIDINTLSMQAWMEQNGADPKSVRFVELPTLQAPVALEEGRVDGATLFNPAYAKALADGKSRLIAPIFDAVAKHFLLGAWFTTTDWVQKNRPVAERFSRVVVDAVNAFNKNPDDTLDDMVAFTGLDRSLMSHMQRTSQTPTLNPAELQPVIDAAARYGIIDKSFPAGDLMSDAAAKSTAAR